MSYNPNFAGATAAASQSIQTSESNNSGNTLSKLTPVMIDSLGDIDTVDVSVEADALAIAGIVDSDISDGSSGNIVNSGRITNITTPAVLGDVLYVSKTGGTTNTKPEIGAGGFLSGDFVIRLGIVAKNLSNPSNKDLVVGISVIGQL